MKYKIVIFEGEIEIENWKNYNFKKNQNCNFCVLEEDSWIWKKYNSKWDGGV